MSKEILETELVANQAKQQQVQRELGKLSRNIQRLETAKKRIENLRSEFDSAQSQYISCASKSSVWRGSNYTAYVEKGNEPLKKGLTGYAQNLNSAIDILYRKISELKSKQSTLGSQLNELKNIERNTQILIESMDAVMY